MPPNGPEYIGEDLAELGVGCLYAPSCLEKLFGK